jgi:hypothetical protein
MTDAEARGRGDAESDLSPAFRKLASQAKQTEPTQASDPLDLSPEAIEKSPVLQRWLKGIPNVLEEIQNDPSFRTRVRLGYTQFPSSGHVGGLSVGVDNLFVGKTGLTLSGDYQTSFSQTRQAGGANLQYYILPLGGYVNVAPVVGYRYIQTHNYSTDGVNVGVRLMLVLSRTGAADISVTQSFMSPGSSNEVGITSLSVGYAVTKHLRLSADIQEQNSIAAKDSQVGILLEWMP